MKSENPIVLFDGLCNLCNSSVNFIIRFDTTQKFKFAPLQSNVAKQLLHQKAVDPLKLNSIVLCFKEKVYTESSAALLIAKELAFPISWLYVFIIVPKFIRDFIYRIVARNRYRWFGKQETCMLPDKSLKNRFLA